MSWARRFAFVFAFGLWSAVAAAGSLTTLGAGGPPAGGGGGGYTGPGDIVSGAAFWVGLRAYSSSIAAGGTQKLANIRNTVTNETCDIIVASNGGFGNVASCSGSSNGLSVATFCALSSGTCKIAELYDQTGNGVHFLQTTAANQPTLNQSCIGSLPCVQSAGSPVFMTATTTTQAQPGSFAAEYTQTTNGGYNQLTGSVSDGVNWAVQTDNSGGSKACTGSSALLCAALSLSQEHAVQGVWNGASNSVINVDGAETTGNAGTNGQGTPTTLLAQAGGGNHFLIGHMAEYGEWYSVNNSTQRTNLCHNIYTYWGTVTSC